jgi:MerR family transcriptional regulator, light-induced transcriptional regulator
MSRPEPGYNLKAVIRETGLSPEVLRAWERRYGLPNPERSPGGHRLYSQRDIALLKWLVARQTEGLSISRAVGLWKSLEAGGQDPLKTEPGLWTEEMGGPALDEQRRRWVNACLNFDELGANTALTQALATASPETACLEVLQKGLHEIGEMWYTGKASVQQEHFASTLAMRRLHALLAAAPLPNRHGRILAACPPGEEHEFGLLLSTFLLRWRGWGVIYLGANVPLERLEEAVRSTSPMLVLSLAQTLPAAASLRDMAALFTEAKIPLAYGGLIFNLVPELRNHIPGHFLGDDFSGLATRVEQAARRPESPAILLQADQKHLAALELFRVHQPLIVARVNTRLESGGIDPGQLTTANQSLGQHIVAALSLGDICLIRHSVSWVEQMLENLGLPPEMLPGYIEAYKDAVQENLGEGGQLIVACLESYLDEDATS